MLLLSPSLKVSSLILVPNNNEEDGFESILLGIRVGHLVVFNIDDEKAATTTTADVLRSTNRVIRRERIIRPNNNDGTCRCRCRRFIAAVLSLPLLLLFLLVLLWCSILLLLLLL